MWDENNYELILSDRIVELTLKENIILKLLVNNKDKFVSLETICYNIYNCVEEDLKQCTRMKIHYLKKKIAQEYEIINKNRVGYKIRYKGTR